jgi:hypothetical protein
MPVQYDIKIVIVNDPEYGGSGGRGVTVSSTDSRGSEIILHELGHSFGLLADEYSGTSCGFLGSYPNVTATTDRNQIQWNYWIDPATPIPTYSTSPAIPGLYQGADVCNSYYRPTYDSKMRTLNRPFEQINTEQLIKRIYNVASPIDSSAPEPAALTINQGQDLAFSITKLAPFTHAVDVTWYVDGQPQTNSDTFLFQSATLSVGTHAVDVLVKDNTSLVRRDPQELLADTRHWDVTINAAATPTPTPTPTPSGPPELLTEVISIRAIALDSVTMLRDPFSVFNAHNFSSDQRTRIILFASNVNLAAGEPISVVTAQAEVGQQAIPLTVEHVGTVPNSDGLTSIYVRLPDQLGFTGDVMVSITVRGLPSNKALISLKAPP